ncbi:MAG TPA: anti-sigma regulatory factor [Clostridiales bacterium]|jgi:anti-sigma regulatory factor (Ser/Thr protein kinase)|nr:anti-sigma regulatory factor [Clostridiales bacterium]
MEELIKRYEYEVVANDFDIAGSASSAIKRNLKSIGVDPGIVRKVAIVSYEAEINIIIHSKGGVMCLEIYRDRLTIRAHDNGPGIMNIELAMSEGFSTATNEAREFGFGAGMGLPNMKKYSDNFNITSSSDGTKIDIDIYMD